MATSCSIRRRREQHQEHKHMRRCWHCPHHNTPGASSRLEHSGSSAKLNGQEMIFTIIFCLTHRAPHGRFYCANHRHKAHCWVIRTILEARPSVQHDYHELLDGTFSRKTSTYIGPPRRASTRCAIDTLGKARVRARACGVNAVSASSPTPKQICALAIFPNWFHPTPCTLPSSAIHVGGALLARTLRSRPALSCRSTFSAVCIPLVTLAA